MIDPHSARSVRVRGWALIVLGLGVGGALMAIMANIGPDLLSHGTEAGAGAATTLTPQGVWTFLLLVAALAAAVALLLNGVHMARFATVNRWTARAVIVAGIIVIAIGLQTNRVLS